MDDVGQAEYATLGSLLLAPAGLDRVAGWLHLEDFRDLLGREVFGVLLATRDRSVVIDPVPLLGELRRRGRLAGDGVAAMALIRMVKGRPHAPSRGRLRPVGAGGLDRSAGLAHDNLPAARVAASAWQGVQRERLRSQAIVREA